MSDQAFQNEAEQLNAYLQKQQRARVEGQSKVIMDFGAGPEDASKYLSMRHPGLVPMRMYADPYCALKDGEKKREAWKGPIGGQFVWRYASGKHARHTKAGVHQGYLRPVQISEIDEDSPHALFDETSLDTKDGPKKIVTYEGLCLYEVRLDKSIEWFQTPVDMHKATLTEMAYGGSKALRSEGYGAVSSEALRAMTGASASVDSNMAVGRGAREDALNEGYSGR